MLVAAALMVLLTKTDSNKLLDQPVFRTGMFAVVLAFGLCWLVNTFIADQSSFITDNMSALTNQYPWIYIITFKFFTNTFTFFNFRMKNLSFIF